MTPHIPNKSSTNRAKNKEQTRLEIRSRHTILQLDIFRGRITNINFLLSCNQISHVCFSHSHGVSAGEREHRH